MIVKIGVLVLFAIIVIKRKAVIKMINKIVGPRPPKPPNG